MRVFIGLLLAGLLIWIGVVPTVAEHLATLAEIVLGLMLAGAASLLTQPALLLISLAVVGLRKRGLV